MKLSLVGRVESDPAVPTVSVVSAPNLCRHTPDCVPLNFDHLLLLIFDGTVNKNCSRPLCRPQRFPSPTECAVAVWPLAAGRGTLPRPPPRLLPTPLSALPFQQWEQLRDTTYMLPLDTTAARKGQLGWSGPKTRRALRVSMGEGVEVSKRYGRHCRRVWAKE